MLFGVKLTPPCFQGSEGKSTPNVPDLPEEAYDPPLSELPCSYYFLRNLGPERSICTVWIEDIDKCSTLDWFGQWCDNIVRAVILGQRLLCLHWPAQAVIATYGPDADIQPFIGSPEVAQAAARQLHARLTNDKSHTMRHHVLDVAELQAPGQGYFNPLCWGFSQMEEMRFILTYFRESCDVMPSDAVLEGDAGDPHNPWTYMQGLLRKPASNTATLNDVLADDFFSSPLTELNNATEGTESVS